MSSPESKCFGCPVQIECSKNTAVAVAERTEVERKQTIAKLKKLMFAQSRGLLAEPITGEEKVDTLDLSTATPEDRATLQHYDEVINNHMDMIAACNNTIRIEVEDAKDYSDHCSGTLVIDSPEIPGTSLNICTALGPYIADLN